MYASVTTGTLNHQTNNKCITYYSNTDIIATISYHYQLTDALSQQSPVSAYSFEQLCRSAQQLV